MVQLKPGIQSTFQESTLKFYLNGTKIKLYDPNPQWTLLDFIRSQDDLKGQSLDAAKGCGACTVVLQTIVKAFDSRKIKHVAVNACLFPLIGAVGKHIITIEGLGDAGHPHPLQERIAKLHGSQCGFCTPVLSCHLLMASGAILTIQSRAQGKRDISISDFFVSYRTTKLPDDAVVVNIRVPLSPPEAREIIKAYKQAKRKDDDIAIVTAAFRVRFDNDDIVSQVSLILAAELDLKYDVPGGMASYRRTLAISLFFRFWHEVVADIGFGKVDPDLINEIHRGISSGTRDNHNPSEQRVVGKQIPHLSSLKQTTGEAEYIDDIPRQHRELFGAMVLSSRAHAKLVEVDWTPAIKSGLALGYIDINSIPKDANLWGSIIKDEPFFADGEVFSHGQPIGLVYADTALQAQAAARAVRVDYEDLPVIITIDEAIDANSYFPIGGQEHFYLETNAALVIPNKEDGTYEVWSSTQNSMETQEFVAQVTGVPSSRVNARVKRMGGAFGGKESRSVQLACLLAVAAKKTKRPLRCMLNRDEDMITTGQRHPMQARWKVGVQSDGNLIALEADVYNNAGFSQDMSAAVMGRCLTHFDNCYEIPNVLLRGHVCKTNTHSNTAFRGFGGPQAMFFAETFMTAISEGLNMPIDETPTQKYLQTRRLYTISPNY
ncbi:hypothetical protein DID88_005226 [Monilinia fructigena]|uniref:Xanthine dehydrogenase n=1 Tax=Monilinia fructigena TaxID=38457 RepID=A0A395IZ80_9HELO|nr:hypothetical protein DID88_005226 [Monilinia fructigena]